MRDGDAAVLGEDGHEAVELDTPALDKVAVPNMKELSQYARLCSINNPYFHIIFRRSTLYQLCRILQHGLHGLFEVMKVNLRKGQKDIHVWTGL